MKKFILSIVSLFLLGTATAIASNVLVIHLTDGTSYSYILLEEKPVINFQGDRILVTTSTTEHSFYMEAVTYFNYVTQDATGIEEEISQEGMQMNGDRIVFNGLPAGCPIYIYGVGGQLYLKMTADADGSAVVDLTSLNKGVYIVKANEISTKITKK
jgi:hypothetical protein